ncbi:MAG: HDOD domain-containing protein [Ketobacteraceae bacterium]|nr:HDOD domain-containing protein [Ketobacteraceae bacterium]
MATLTANNKKPEEFQKHVQRLHAKINEDIEYGIKPLPDFPGIAQRLGDLVRNPNYRASDLAELLERDQSLSSLIIRIASSALYPVQEPCEDLNTAIRRMGAETTSNLVLTYCLHNLFRSDIKDIQQRLTRIWTLDTRAAATAAWIGRYAQGIKAEDALFAGLLQNVGTYFLLSRFGDKIKNDYHWELFNALISQDSKTLSERILTKWRMPDHIIAVAATKDDWMRDGIKEPDVADVLIVARYHVYLNTSLIKSAPRYTDMPAAKRLKLKKSEATPFQGLRFVHEEQDAIKDIIRMLAI